MKTNVLIVADWYWKIYAQAFFDAFVNQGCKTYAFSWDKYFKGAPYLPLKQTGIDPARYFLYKLQNKFITGPIVKRINDDLVNYCQQINPDLIFIYRGTHIFPETIAKLKNISSCKIYGYNNDDPFSIQHPSHLWRFYLKSIPFYDHIFSYRYKNIKDYQQTGYTQVSLLRSYYLNKKNFPIETLPNQNYRSEVTFIGHFEDDGRDEAIKGIIDVGIDLKLYGTGWEKSKYYNFFKQQFGSIKPVYSDYNLALNSTKIALVFLSKLNNDTYTRRCFEIPATKTMMMAEYSKDLASNLFDEGKEAEYFRNKEELLQKIKYYLDNHSLIKKIGDSGYVRLLDDGHEVNDRVKTILSLFHNSTID